MKKFRTTLSLTLILAMTMTGICPANANPASSIGIPVPGQGASIRNSDPQNSNTENRFKKDTETPAAKEADYVPGDVLVGLYPEEADKTDDARLGAAASMISEGRDLMDITSSAVELSGEDTAGISEENADEPTLGASLDERYEDKKAVIRLIHSDEYSTEELIEMYSSYPGVIFAEPNYINSLSDTEDQLSEEEYTELPDRTTEETSDEIQPEQIVAQDPAAGDDTQSIPDMTALQYACTDGPGGIDVPDWNNKDNINATGVIAILDTGVDYLHPDLAPVMWDEGEKYPSLTKMGGGKYGLNCASVYNGYPSTDPMDHNFHGSHCAGIVAGAWNDFGISGMANGTKIMALNVSVNDNGQCDDSSILTGYEYIIRAKKAGVNVIAVNCSFGGADTSYILNYAAKELEENNIMSIWSSGNDSVNTDLDSFSHSAIYDQPCSIVVDSNTITGDISGFSNYGIRSTTLFAPGSGILSTVLTSKPSSIDDPAISRPVRDISSNIVLDDYKDNKTYFIRQVNGSNGTACELSDGMLRIKGTIPIMDEPDEITKETTGGDPGIGTVALTLTAPSPLSRPADGKEYRLITREKSNTHDLALKIYVKTHDGHWKRPGGTYFMDKQFGSNSYTLDSDKFDLNDLQIRMVVYSSDDKATTPVDEIDLESIWISDIVYPYGKMDGTSMSTPAVTGMAAVLAKAFPDDSTAKRTARILAGVSSNETLKYSCITGGIANMRNSLDEKKYTPVINMIRENNNALTIEGYFFGTRENTTVTLTQGKNTYSSKNNDFKITSVEGKDPEKILLTRPEGLTAGEVKVTVTDSEKPVQDQSFTRILYLNEYSKADKKEKHIFTDIPLPKEYTWFYPQQIFPLKDRIIFAGYDCHDLSNMTLSYTIKSKKWTALKHPINLKYDNPGTTWNKRYVQILPEGNTTRLYTWDTSKSYADDVLMTFDKEGFSPRDPHILYNDGDKVYIFSTPSNKDENNNLPPTQVWELDPALAIARKLTELKGRYTRPLVTQKEDNMDNGIKKTLYISGINEYGADDKLETECLEVTSDGLKTVSSPNLTPSKPIHSAGSTQPVTGCSLKDGIFLCGVYNADSDEVTRFGDITADSFIYKYGSMDHFEPQSEKLMPRQVNYSQACAYKNNVYITGVSAGKTNIPFFCVMSSDTLTAYGDKRYSTDEDIKVKKLKLDKKKAGNDLRRNRIA